MERLVQNQSSFITKVHICAYGMKIPDKEGNEFVLKPTQFLTNSPLLAAQLERHCDKNHQHARLASNRTKQAAIYPPQLIEAICNGINEQIKADKLDQNIIARIEYIEGSNVLAEVQKAIENAAKCHEEDHQDLIAFDDVSGAELDPKKVQKRCDSKLFIRMLRVDQTILGHGMRQEAEGSLHLRRRAVSTTENDDIRSQLFQELPRRRISPEKCWKKSWTAPCECA